MRFLPKNINLIKKDERNILYRYDEELGWFPLESSKKLFNGSPRFSFNRYIEIAHNSRGFRDSEHTIDAKSRILFLGDSFVWGYNVEKQERFTEKLREKLADSSLYNLGVSGYGTDQEYLLLKRHYGFYSPNVVFLVFTTENDRDDNSHNVRYGRYYKPYFTGNLDDLALQGVPVPKAENYFIASHDILSHSYWFALLAHAYFLISSPPSLNINDPTHEIIAHMNTFVKASGAEFLVGLTGTDTDLEKFLKNTGINYLDLSNSYRYPSDGNHWTPDGHTFVSEKIYNFLMQGKYLQRLTAPNKPPHMDMSSAIFHPRQRPTPAG